MFVIFFFSSFSPQLFAILDEFSKFPITFKPFHTEKSSNMAKIWKKMKIKNYYQCWLKPEIVLFSEFLDHSSVWAKVLYKKRVSIFM